MSPLEQLLVELCEAADEDAYEQTGRAQAGGLSTEVVRLALAASK